jgi:hypothetical protein
MGPNFSLFGLFPVVKPVEKPAAMDLSDFEIINGPDGGPDGGLDDSPDDRQPRQPSKDEVSSPKTRMGTIYIEAQAKPDYTGSLSKVCNHSWGIPTFISEANSRAAHDQA